MITLTELSVDFNDELTPFFQVNSNNRIRFGLSEISYVELKSILDYIFKKVDTVDMVYLVANIISNKYIYTKTAVRKSIFIRNWEEIVEENEEARHLYAIVKNIDITQVQKYALSIYKGRRAAYLAFYLKDRLVYISSDVVDIISDDVQFISHLKEKFSNLYNKYYEWLSSYIYIQNNVPKRKFGNTSKSPECC